MPVNEYHFITRWRMPGAVREVVETLADVAALPRWWPSVYLAVREIAPGNADGTGRTFDLYTRGWLPYTLRWRFRVAELDLPRRVVLEAEGDFVGRGVWSFAQEGDITHVSYDWRVRAEKPLLRRFTWLLRPVFVANHRWAMAMGERSLRLELARRRARSPAERDSLPPPPGPSASGRWLGALGLLAAALLLARRRLRLG